MAESYTIILGL